MSVKLQNLQALKALRAICDAIVETVSAQGHTGAPAGVIYAALATQGCTLEQFNGIMAGIVSAGLLWKDGLTYFATGREVGASSAPRGWEQIEAGKEVD